MDKEDCLCLILGRGYEERVGLTNIVVITRDYFAGRLILLTHSNNLLCEMPH
jgi:hypothetical protein